MISDCCFVWKWTHSKNCTQFCEVEQAGRKPVADPAPNLAVGVLKYDGTLLPLNPVIWCKTWTHIMRYPSISHSWYFAALPTVGFVVMRLLRVVSWLVRQSPYSHQSSATMMISKVKKMPFSFPRLRRGKPINPVNPVKPTRLTAPVEEVVPSPFEQFCLIYIDQPLRLSSHIMSEFSKSQFWVWMKLSTNAAVQILDKVAMQWMNTIKVSSKNV